MFPTSDMVAGKLNRQGQEGMLANAAPMVVGERGETGGIISVTKLRAALHHCQLYILKIILSVEDRCPNRINVSRVSRKGRVPFPTDELGAATVQFYFLFISLSYLVKKKDNKRKQVPVKGDTQLIFGLSQTGLIRTHTSVCFFRLD